MKLVNRFLKKEAKSKANKSAIYFDVPHLHNTHILHSLTRHFMKQTTYEIFTLVQFIYAVLHILEKRREEWYIHWIMQLFS